MSRPGTVVGGRTRIAARDAHQGITLGGRCPHGPILVLMAMTLSKAMQETAVGEGLALGCVALGVDAIEGSKMDLELAFRHAWRAWPCRSTFPQVHADAERDDLLRILNKSEGRRSAHLSGWASQWPFVPYVAEAWTVEDVAEILQGSTGVPFAGWIELARSFVDDLHPDPGDRVR